VSAFDDEFGLFGEDEAGAEEERRSTLGARKISSEEAAHDDIERPRTNGRAAVRAGDRRERSGDDGDESFRRPRRDDPDGARAERGPGGRAAARARSARLSGSQARVTAGAGCRAERHTDKARSWNWSSNTRISAK